MASSDSPSGSSRRSPASRTARGPAASKARAVDTKEAGGSAAMDDASASSAPGNAFLGRSGGGGFTNPAFPAAPAQTPPFAVPDEFVEGFFKSAASLLPAMNPDNLMKLGALQAEYWQEQAALWGSLATSATAPAKVIDSEPGDRRFNNDEWRHNPMFNLLKQSYLLNTRLISKSVEALDVDDRTKHRMRFYSKQYADAMSPANFPLTNPEVLQHLSQTQGATLSAGMKNMLDDYAAGKISITDESAFEVGRNVAVSEGAVVYQNDLMQLIQYSPSTDKVGKRPLVIVPPCINKFYILDLQPANSFVRYATEQGHTVFVVSWQNAADRLQHTTWDDYLSHGALRAIEVAREITGADQANVVGWCVGGTIVASALAVMRGRGEDWVSSVTLLTTLLDFEESGDLGVFIDEEGVRQRERTLGQGGVYPGKELAFVFQTLRPNDLIWPYVINNYMKGKSPDAFDLLYWNADSTNLPGPMYSWYLRNLYLENNLREPGRLVMCDVPVDLSKVDMPSYVLATAEDHIVPWKSAFRTVELLGGKPEFVLGASGHIAGVINPAAKNRRSFQSGGRSDDDADAWLESSTSTPGSWWTHWTKWITPFQGKQVPARKELGSPAHRPIESAPGSYVKVRA